MENTKMAVKRIRGANYTPEETEKLLELISQYHFTIEDKRKGAVYLAQKKEAWEKVCIAYNAVATSGLRSVDQLKVLYDNKKQKTRKVVAEKNKNEYIKLNLITEEEVKEAIQQEKVNKGQNMKTGGGRFCPTLTDHDLKILNLIKDQVTPQPNSCDSAAIYFGDVAVSANDNQSMDYIFSNVTVPTDIEILTSKKQINRNHKLKSKVAELNIKKKKQINYKQLYFKRKSQNAVLERRKLYQEIRLRQHSFVFKEHQMRLNFLQKEHEARMKSLQENLFYN